MPRDERRLERIVKGFSNHRRIQIMRLLRAQPGLSLDQVAAICRINDRTAGEHVRRLALAGLIDKPHRGRMLELAVTPRGKRILEFLDVLR